jgi:hypothetical protein
MSANFQEATLSLDRTTTHARNEQVRKEQTQVRRPVVIAEPGRSAAGFLAAVADVGLNAAYALRQLLQQTAPAGESTFKRQML